MIEKPDIYQATALLIATVKQAGVTLEVTDGPNRTDAIDWAVRRVERERWRMIKETGRAIWTVGILGDDGHMMMQAFHAGRATR
jgi:hypothetical protein